MANNVDTEIKVSVKDFSPQVLQELDKQIERALYFIGTSVVEGSVMAISGEYNKDELAVDTGRLRASISFITPETASGAPTGVPVPETAKKIDLLTGRARKNSVVFGSNVNYASYVHNGTGKMPPRPFLRTGVDKKLEDIKKGVSLIFKGEL